MGPRSDAAASLVPLHVTLDAALNDVQVRVVRERWKHSASRSAFLPRRVRQDGPKVAPGGKVYGEWLAALVEEFGPSEVAGWSSEKELPLEWDYGVWIRGQSLKLPRPT